MPTYLVIYEQDGEGCDYTIGCGVRVDEIEADDMDDALSMTADEVFGDDGMEHDERTFASVCVVPTEHVRYLALETHRAAKRLREADAQRVASEQRERAELARLQAKYGG